MKTAKNFKIRTFACSSCGKTVTKYTYEDAKYCTRKCFTAMVHRNAVPRKERQRKARLATDVTRRRRVNMILNGHATDQKKCFGCENTKALSEFGFKSPKADGWNTFCRACLRTMATKGARGKKQWMKDYKATLECVVCGEHRHQTLLDFHHIDSSTKQISIGSGIGTYALHKIKAEIEKCIVLCKNCHTLFHHGKIKLTSELIQRSKVRIA